MNKKFLITGGTGFIGSNIANMLVSKGYDVVIFDNCGVRCVEKKYWRI